MEKIIITDIPFTALLWRPINDEKNCVRAVQESCWSDDTFSTVRGTTKTKKNMQIYRRDTDVFLPIFLKGVGVCKQARGPPL